jgi:hypothetical protein
MIIKTARVEVDTASLPWSFTGLYICAPLLGEVYRERDGFWIYTPWSEVKMQREHSKARQQAYHEELEQEA